MGAPGNVMCAYCAKLDVSHLWSITLLCLFLATLCSEEFGAVIVTMFDIRTHHVSSCLRFPVSQYQTDLSGDKCSDGDYTSTLQ